MYLAFFFFLLQSSICSEMGHCWFCLNLKPSLVNIRTAELNTAITCSSNWWLSPLFSQGWCHKELRCMSHVSNSSVNFKLESKMNAWTLQEEITATKGLRIFILTIWFFFLKLHFFLYCLYFHAMHEKHLSPQLTDTVMKKILGMVLIPLISYKSWFSGHLGLPLKTTSRTTSDQVVKWGARVILTSGHPPRLGGNPAEVHAPLILFLFPRTEGFTAWACRSGIQGKTKGIGEGSKNVSTFCYDILTELWN